MSATTPLPGMFAFTDTWCAAFTLSRLSLHFARLVAAARLFRNGDLMAAGIQFECWLDVGERVDVHAPQRHCLAWRERKVPWIHDFRHKTKA